jgi:hypothetical protein
MTKVYISGVVDAIGFDQPPYPSTGPGFPTNPIAPGGQPPGIWPSPGHPSHPIAPGGQPPGIWGGGNMPGVSPPIYIPIDPPEGIEAPVSPSHPIYIPIYPAHPIAPGDPEAIKQAIKEFLTGNLPPAVQPVRR